MEKVGIFALSLLFRVETIYVPLNHPVLSNVDRLGLFHFFPDVQPLELFLVVLKNVFDFQWQQDVCPLQDMGSDPLLLNELQNG